MNASSIARSLLATPRCVNSRSTTEFHRYLSSVSLDGRYRYSNFWIPPISIRKDAGQTMDSNTLLAQTGYLRQAHAGIYHLLPLGLRVQDKLERLIDTYMRSLGASRTSLSSISSQELWQQSGRLDTGSEFFTFKDRKDARFLLAPTHEEEITSVVSSYVHSYKQLPVRLYQIGRKYRDEKRPRGGLLRGREFLMKDLYTFDENVETALSTYDAVRAAYRSMFDALKLRYIEAQADSGNMGGNLSHEYHFPNPKGEDKVISCSSCNFAKNEEVVEEVQYHLQEVPLHETPQTLSSADLPGLFTYTTISKDGRSLVKALAPKSAENEDSNPINLFAVKAACPESLRVDTGEEGPDLKFLESIRSNTLSAGKGKFAIYHIFDYRVSPSQREKALRADRPLMVEHQISAFQITSEPESSNALDLLKHKDGDACPKCADGRLHVEPAIEVGHTFHLGTRYSAKLGADIMQSGSTVPVPVQMGCHGIGVSRLIAAIASCLSDARGLNWPAAVAPFKVAIVTAGGTASSPLDEARSKAAATIYDELLATGQEAGESIDAIIDDRTDASLVFKLNDADAIGYPVIVVAGKAWAKGKLEVQCRRLAFKQDVPFEDVSSTVRELLAKL